MSLPGRDLRVGTVVRAEPNADARRPALVLWVDFGEVGELKTSARISQRYTPAALIGTQVIGVLDVEPRQVGRMMSRFLLLGVEAPDGVVLLRPEAPVENGSSVS